MIRLVHLTDPHLTDPNIGSFSHRRLKRFLGLRSWQRKRRFVHQYDILQSLLEAVHAERADQILLTGDLVQIGLPQEIAAAANWLTQLGPPEMVSLVLGNHDVYAADSWPAIARHWQPYLGLGENLTGPLQALYPSERTLYVRDACVKLVGLCSSLPTPVFMASGRLGTQQLLDYEQKAYPQDVFECVLIHHPPLPGMSHWRKALHDAQPLDTLWQRRPPAMVVHGHVHKNESCQMTKTRVFGTASASSGEKHHPASFRVFDISREEGAWHVTMALKQLNLLSGLFEVVEETQWRPQGCREGGSPE